MKSTPVVRLTRLFAAALCIISLSVPQHGPACSGSRGPVCTVNPAACLKSMVLTKSVPGPIFPIPAAGVGTLVVSNNLFIVCPTTNNCGGVCTNVGVPVSASLTLTLSPPAPPFCPAGSPALSATISTAGGTMALPLCSPFGTFNPYLVTVLVPGGTCPGLYTVVGTATVTFSDGTVLTQTGDTAICLVPEAPGQPGVPRLDMQLLTPSFPRIAPGDVHIARYLIKNNDPSNSVTLTAFATSRQAALRPQGGNEANGVFSIATPFGDDFPIAFLATSNCIPLPTHPYTQPMISNTLPVIPPGGTNIVQVGIRSYGQCNSGSCSESILRVQGTFSDSSAALGCASMAVSVDTSLPSTGCAVQVNDCNHNGIPDPLDIILRISQDQNFNGVPDECEGAIGIPYFSSVAPNLAGPGAPIQVQVAFQEPFPFSNVWANGSALILSNFFGSPLWYGTIPADTRPGPQTVYFLGKDTRGILSSYIALYQVIAPPTITQQPLTQEVPQNGNATLTVAATGDPVLNYQWRKNGLAISGATSNSYSIFNAQPPDGATYDVIVNNPGGTVFSSPAIVRVSPSTYKIATVPIGQIVTATLTETEEDQGLGLKCIIPNAQWLHELDWGLTETTPTNGVSSLSDLLLLRNEGNSAVIILISDNSLSTPFSTPNALLIASAATLQFMNDVLVSGGQTNTVKITLLDDDVNFSDTLIVQVIPRIPPIYKVADVPTNGTSGVATLTETEEDQGIALKCYIRNAQWVRELDWGLTETTVSNGVSSLSDVLMLRNEGPDAVVILLSDNSLGSPAPPRPNTMLVPSSDTLKFQGNLVLNSGPITANAIANITLLDDNVNFSDTLIVQLVPPYPTTFKVINVPTNGAPGIATLTESEELAGYALKCYIRNAQWVQEQDWGLTETTVTNGISGLSDLLLLRNEGPDAVVILLSDADGPLLPPRPNPILVASADTLKFQAELLVLGGTNTTANITVLDDNAYYSDTLIVQVTPRIPLTYKVADVPTNGTPGIATLTESEEQAGLALKCIIRNAQWIQELDWGFIETTNRGTSLSDLLLLRNEGPDAVVILYSDAETGLLVPPRPNTRFLLEAAIMRFQAELLILGGTNATANITVQNDIGGSDVLIVQVIPRVPSTFKVADVPTNGLPGTVTLTETEEDVGTAIKCYIRNAQWVQELDWAFLETATSTNISDLLLLRNEGPDAVVIFISDSETGPPLIPPRADRIKVVETPVMRFQGELFVANGTNATADITVQNDQDPTTGFSDVLTVQVIPRTPPIFVVGDVPTNGQPATAGLTEADEDNGVAIKCYIRNAKWFQEADWVFLETSTSTNVSDLLLLRNEGPDAVVIFISDSEIGPPLVPPRPNYRKALEQPAMQFQADFLSFGGLNRTAQITVQNDLDPTAGFSDILTVKVVPLLRPVVTIVPGLTAVTGVTNTPTIDWSGFGVLQTAPSLPGPWADLSDAENPLTIPATGPGALFRIRVP